MSLRCKAAMCHVCLRKRGCSTWRIVTAQGGFTPVSLDGCPMGRWPREDGTVLWWRMRWLGVPFPIRLWLALVGAWVAFRTRMSSRWFAGCGCHAKAKAVVQSVTKGVRHGVER